LKKLIKDLLMSSYRPTLDDIVSLCKRRGFVFQSAEIYGGLNGVYDFGPLGTILKNNLRNAWTKAISSPDKTVFFLEGALLGPESTWKASGHIDNFNDPMVDCTNCKKRFRADDPDIDLNGPCPHCGKKAWTQARQFNMMFKTELGAVAGQVAYLRPETAQSIFINFKNVMSSNRVKIPFGIAQIGKSFRNEITPKQFLFRMREFEQMEIEWFCTAESSHNFFDYWCKLRLAFYETIGLTISRIRLRPHDKDELSHYSSKTSDVEYEYPFGWKELEGIAHRGDYDLSQHSKFSGKDLSVFDEETQTSFMPNVVECSVGTDRLFLTVLFDAYSIDTLGGEERTVLKLHPIIAPVKAAFLPLSKKLSENMLPIYRAIAAAGFAVEFDESGSIGKRYRRQDEIGTPVCFTYDFDSLNDNCVTVRDRDTLKQERINIEKIELYLADMLKTK
jgi:glycyl-tRNA synthetase